MLTCLSIKPMWNKDIYARAFARIVDHCCTLGSKCIAAFKDIATFIYIYISIRALYPCSTKTREVLGNPSPTAERFPETRGKKFRGSREILRAEGMDFPIRPEFWWSTDILSSSIFPQGVDQKMLKSILPCWWWENAACISLVHLVMTYLIFVFFLQKQDLWLKFSLDKRRLNQNKNYVYFYQNVPIFN